MYLHILYETLFNVLTTRNMATVRNFGAVSGK
jgi:hypothetical protein